MKAARGNVVWITTLQLFGVVTEVDEPNHREGGEMNTRIRTFRDGKIEGHNWWMDHEFDVIDDGSY